MHPLAARESSTMQAGDVQYLSPTLGNVHTFHAREWTCVFDILVPPYSDELGRSCNYYELEARNPSPKAEGGAGGELSLRKVPCPEEFWTRHGLYQGPSPF